MLMLSTFCSSFSILVRMANNSLKVSELPQASNVSSTDRVMVLYSPNSNPSVRTITVANLALAIGGGGSANLTAVNTSIVPANTNTYSLGTKTNAWSNLNLTTSNFQIVYLQGTYI